MTETEIKIRCTTNPIEHHPELSVQLIVPRHFEDNRLFDFPDQRLHATNRTLRLRQTEQENWLTFKDSPLPHTWLKIRPEYQVAIDTPDAMQQILHALGLQQVFRYQKYRTVFRVVLPDQSELHAMYDETPMGNYLELEGDAASIRKTVDLLGVSPAATVTASYPTLWRQYLQQIGSAPRDMIFEQERPVPCVR